MRWSAISPLATSMARLKALIALHVIIAYGEAVRVACGPTPECLYSI